MFHKIFLRYSLSVTNEILLRDGVSENTDTDTDRQKQKTKKNWNTDLQNLRLHERRKSGD